MLNIIIADFIWATTWVPDSCCVLTAHLPRKQLQSLHFASMKSKKNKDGTQTSLISFCYATLNAILFHSACKSNLPRQKKPVKSYQLPLIGKEVGVLPSQVTLLSLKLHCCNTARIELLPNP